MKNLGITQRVEIIESYNERRDCLDQNWNKFAFELGYNPVPLANIQPQFVAQYIKDLKLDAIILSGGNSLYNIDSSAKDVAQDRDEFETELITQAIKLNIPLIGVCRGLQIINSHFGGNLSPIESHVAIKHKLINKNTHYIFPSNVNSYHNWTVAAQDLADELTLLATDIDGNIESLAHKQHKILAIMWHPEREMPFLIEDLQLFKEFFHD